MASTTTISETLTELLSHLVSMPTVSADHATNRAALDWVEQQLTGLPLNIKRLERNGVPSLIATTAGVKDPKNPKLWLAAHTDVIPASPASFNPQIRDGRLYGRGAYDMKLAIPTYIVLLHELSSRLDDLDLGLMLTADEEVSGADGVGWLVAQGYRGGAVVLPDSLKTWQLEIGAKGASFWRFTGRGQQAHGSRVWEGDNALERLFKFIDVLKSHVPAEPCGDPSHLHSTLNVGKLSGGLVVNQVPHSAEAEVDIRIAPADTLDDVAAWVTQAQATVPAIEAEQLPIQVKPTKLPVTAPVKLYCNIAADVIGQPLPRVFAHGGTDARWFAEYQVPVITVSPAGGGFHTDDEWVDLADLARFYEVNRRFVTEYAKV